MEIHFQWTAGGKGSSIKEYISHKMYHLKLIIFFLLSYLSLGVIIAWYRGILSKRSFTYIPFLGGVLGVIALYVNPIIDMGYMILIPLFVDYFSFPYLILLMLKKIINK